MVVNLSDKPGIIHQYLAEIRDVSVQNDRLRFRHNLQRIAEVAGIEISHLLPWKKETITTPLAKATVSVLEEQPLIANILRAGLPMHQGLLHIFDHADSAFISAYRKHDKQGKFIIELEYVSCPSIHDRMLIVADPMLATGSSIALTIKALKRLGEPRSLHIVCAIAAEVGIAKVESELPEATIWAGAIDPELNDKAYIVPGLGDAGDLAYGQKIQS